MIFTLAAPLVLYAIVRTAAAGLSPSLAAALPPTDDAAALRQAARNVAHPQFKVDQPMLALAKRAAVAEPLGFAPYFLAARAADQSADRPRVLALLEEARRRRATWLPIRLQLVSAYFQADRRGDMGKEIDYTLRMNEAARMALLPELVKLMRFPDGRRALADMLAADPPWEGDFFNVARDRRVPPAYAEDLLRLTAARGRDTTQERRLLVNSLISAGRAGEARARWLQSLPAARREQNRLLAYRDFRPDPAAGEFGWTLAALGVGRADVVAGRGESRLRALYDGGSGAVLARQLVALSPGSYRLEVTGRIVSAAAAGQLVWSIMCHPDGATLVRLPASGLGEQDKTISASFSVPGGCSAQMVRLVGEPGDTSAPVEAEFSSIEINDAR